MTEEFKYALRNNKVGFENLVTIIESLIKLEYVDHEIINMLLLYVIALSSRLKNKSNALTSMPPLAIGPVIVIIK